MKWIINCWFFCPFFVSTFFYLLFRGWVCSNFAINRWWLIKIGCSCCGSARYRALSSWILRWMLVLQLLELVCWVRLVFQFTFVKTVPFVILRVSRIELIELWIWSWLNFIDTVTQLTFLDVLTISRWACLTIRNLMSYLLC